MDRYKPRYLGRTQIDQVVSAYLHDLEINALREHLRLFAAEYMAGVELTHESMAALNDALEAERTRLLALAEKEEE